MTLADAYEVVMHLVWHIIVHHGKLLIFKQANLISLNDILSNTSHPLVLQSNLSLLVAKVYIQA